MSPLTLRRYLLDSRPVTWWDLAAVNDPEVMAQIGALEPGQTVTLGMCDHVERLPDAPFGFVVARHPLEIELVIDRPHVLRGGQPCRPAKPHQMRLARPLRSRMYQTIVCVGPDDVGAATGLEVPAGIDLDQRAQVHAATSVDELRSLPFVLG